jgi:hypothetical protein
MINTFLSSSEKIMQTTYTQILRISESIAENNKDGAFLLKILFNTLKIMQGAQSKVFIQVCINICQGLLDILTIGHLSANTKSEKAEERLQESTIVMQIQQEEVGEILWWIGNILSKHLNQGNFEGASGANTMLVM